MSLAKDGSAGKTGAGESEWEIDREPVLLDLDQFEPWLFQAWTANKLGQRPKNERERNLLDIVAGRMDAAAKQVPCEEPTDKPVTVGVFHWDGADWTIRYGGEHFALAEAPGAFYIAFLLERPNQGFGPSELREAYARFRAAPKLSRIAEESKEDRALAVALDSEVGDLGAVLDATGVAAIQRQLRQLEQDTDEAKRRQNDVEVARLGAEKEKLTEYLFKSHRPGGQSRKLNEKLKRDRDTVRNAIDRTLEKIRKKSSALHRHLHNSLKVKDSPLLAYQPEELVPWNG